MKKNILFYLFATMSAFVFGQYQVGHTTITFNDPTRTGGFGSGGGPGRQIQTEIYYPAASAGNGVAMIEEEFPIIVFGHGFAMAWSAYENIWLEMVPKGYIMAFPRTEGGLLPAPSHENFGLDLSVVLDRMLAENALSTSIFHEGINGKGAIMGHSMGGGATFLAAATNTNVVTVIGLGPAETNPSAVAAAANVTVPALILSGDEDSVTPEDEHHTPIYNALNSSCKYFVNIIGGGHCYYANSNFNCDFGESASGNPSLTRPEQQDITYDAITPWLDYYLKGICEAKSDFIDFAENDNRVTSINSCNYTPLTVPTISQNGNVLTSSTADSYQWFKDGVELTGETNQTLETTGDGSYTVVVSDGICFEESDAFVVENNQDECVNPTGVSVAVNETSALVTWLAGGSENQWDILWVVAGQDPLVAANHLGFETVTTPQYNITGLADGNFDVYVRAICGADDSSDWVSASFTIEDDLGFGENNLDASIYPNPTMGAFIVRSNQGVQIETVVILNLQGQRVLAQTVNATEFVVDLSKLNNGMYFVVLQTIDSQTMTSKILKK